MACAACEERRRMIAEAKKKGGNVAVIKVLPKVGRSMFFRPRVKK